MLPSLLSTQVTQGIRDFLRASFWSNAPGFDRMIERLIHTPDALTRGPFIDLKLPFVGGQDGHDFFPDVPMGWPPHAHQERAFERLGGPGRLHTLIATGTGSGKTESFLMPILAMCAAHRKEAVPVRGIKAILIYPMNALAADQASRLASLIHRHPALEGVRAGLFVGQHEEHPTTLMTPEQVVTDRDILTNNPPDILLTNYKMLDYLLMRPKDQRIWQDNVSGTLAFLVVDEIHTFDGAQGTDLACLIRRLKHKLQVTPGSLCCVGTSATLGGERDVSNLLSYAGQLFGETFGPEAVVTEQVLPIEDFLGEPEGGQGQEEGEGGVSHYPTAKALRTLDVTQVDGEAAYLQRAHSAWFDRPLEDQTGSWRVSLGRALKSHAFLRGLLRRLGGRSVELSTLIEAFRATDPRCSRYDHEEMRRAIESFLALISAARSLVSESATQRAERQAQGLSQGEVPLLRVQVQLWQREMVRMVASLEEAPTLAFADDLTGEQRQRHLPVAYCPHCALMGWMTLVKEGEWGTLAVDLKEFYSRYFAYDPRVELILPLGCVEQIGEVSCFVNRHTLSRRLAGPGEEAGPDEARMVTLERATGEKGKRRRSGDCPRCRAKGAMTLVGFRAATLSASLIGQLYASKFNDDKKLLTFSDSVQDAAHRAGFFGARTWRFVVRAGLQQAVEGASKGHDPSLLELGGLMADHWFGQLGTEGFVATFLPPKLDGHQDMEKLREKGQLPGKSDLPYLVRRRLGWEAYNAYTLEARTGRSLPRTSCSVAYVEDHRLSDVVRRCVEVLPNKVGMARKRLGEDEVRRFLLGICQRLIDHGAIFHPEVPQAYIQSGGKDTFEAFTLSPHLKSMGPSSRLPMFLTTGTKSTSPFEHLGSAVKNGWYAQWFEQSLGGQGAGDFQLLAPDHAAAYEVVLDELKRAGIAMKQEHGGLVIWGLCPETLRVSAHVSQLACDRCKREVAIAEHQRELWKKMPCASGHCGGRHVGIDPNDVVLGSGYYRQLYRQGDLVRVNPAEHTGLLERDVRQHIERRFRAGEIARWEPNLLSCTPTLEMGIDIGDLSTALLCSIPPSQANYIQRVGRAGRRDGNAFILSIANAKPHDLYFYAQPLEMLAGEVTTPGVFLDASAVLERQLVAFCLDQWVAQPEVGPNALPATLDHVISGLGRKDVTQFPFNFNHHVQTHRHEVLAQFLGLFGPQEISSQTREHLSGFIHGTGIHQDSGSLVWRIHNGLEEREGQYRTLLREASKMTVEIRRLDDLPLRSEEQERTLKELESAQAALRSLAKGMKKTRTLEFLTDEGLIPNYAFPEQGITLKSIIWQKKKGTSSDKEMYVRTPREYVRPASAALSELAPRNDFFAEGYRVKIERVDLTLSTMERWRFCDLCDHAESLEVGDPHESCPRCGSDTWGDKGQQRTMLRLRQVFASAEAKKGRIRDDSDDRTAIFYTRQMFVSLDSSPTQAWLVDHEEMPFGFEYLPKATFRDINFGELSDVGTKVAIAGQSAVRRGFELCSKCGRVQPGDRDKERVHEPICPARKLKPEAAERCIEPCLYLYREVQSEAVRILLPLLRGGGGRTSGSVVYGGAADGAQGCFWRQRRPPARHDLLHARPRGHQAAVSHALRHGPWRHRLPQAAGARRDQGL